LGEDPQFPGSISLWPTALLEKHVEEADGLKVRQVNAFLAGLCNHRCIPPLTSDGRTLFTPHVGQDDNVRVGSTLLPQLLQQRLAVENNLL
jgi:hypothetical protein